VISLVAEIEIDLEKLASAIGVECKRIKSLFRHNGRLASYFFAPRLAGDLKLREVSEENGPAALMDNLGERFLIRTITKQSGVSFAPQSMRGVGRKYDEAGFIDYVSQYSAFLVLDASRFPKISVFKIYAKDVLDMLINRELNDGLIGYSSFHELANGGLGNLFNREAI